MLEMFAVLLMHAPHFGGKSMTKQMPHFQAEEESQSQGIEESGYAGMEDWMQPKQLIKPDDQLELTDAVSIVFFVFTSLILEVVFIHKNVLIL